MRKRRSKTLRRMGRAQRNPSLHSVLRMESAMDFASLYPSYSLRQTILFIQGPRSPDHSALDRNHEVGKARPLNGAGDGRVSRDNESCHAHSLKVSSIHGRNVTADHWSD